MRLGWTMKIEWVPGAVRKLRYMPATVAMLEAKGRPIVAKANAGLPPDDRDGYMMASRPGARKPWGRHRVSIAAVTIQARRSEAKHNTLVRLLSGGG